MAIGSDRRFTAVAAVGFVRQPQEQDLGAFDRTFLVVQDATDPGNHIVRHVLVDVVGQLDEAERHAEVAGAPAPGQIARSIGKAVAANACAGPERHETEWLGRGRIDHLPDVDTQTVENKASSFSSAMLTCRNVFSRSLVSSASFVDGTGTASVTRLP